MAIAQDSQTVTNLLDLVELVRDKNNGIAIFFEIDELGKQFLRLLRCQNSRRLVEDQYLHVTQEHF